MTTTTTSTAAAPPLGTATRPTAEREVRFITYLIVGALLAGAVLQTFIPPGGLALVAAAGLAGAVAVAVSFLAPGRVRETLAGFRFVATLLFVLAAFAALGTLVLQGQSPGFYVEKYGFLGKLIVALRLDVIFKGLPFALVMALFGASVIASATLRWPISLKRSGFFVCHLGLLTSLAGGAASAVFAIRGRIDLHAGGEHATHVRVTSGGAPTGDYAELGFDLRLDRFELVNYETEYRVGYYEQVRVKDQNGERDQWRLKASFDPDLAKRRLPNGDSFRLKAVYPDFAPVAKAVPAKQGPPALEATLEGRTRWLGPGESLATPDRRAAVVFGWDRPAPPPGIQTAFLVSGAERKVIVHRADGQMELPLQEGAALAGGLVQFGALLPNAARTFEPATASQDWKNPAVVIEVQQQGLPKEQLMLANKPSGFFLTPTRALVFEKRDKEVKAFVSHVTATQGPDAAQRTIAVNDPFTYGGWTLYQVNYNPEDPSYSGLEAVYDPGIFWVFTGFALIGLGVLQMFYVEPRLRGKKAPAASHA